MLAKLAPSVSVDMPEAVLRTAKAAQDAGNAAFLAKQYADALTSYTVAATAIPESTFYRLSRAAVLVELGRLDDVVIECKRVVAIGACFKQYCMCVHLCMYACVCMYALMYVCMYECMNV